MCVRVCITWHRILGYSTYFVYLSHTRCRNECVVFANVWADVYMRANTCTFIANVHIDTNKQANSNNNRAKKKQRELVHFIEDRYETHRLNCVAGTVVNGHFLLVDHSLLILVFFFFALFLCFSHLQSDPSFQWNGPWKAGFTPTAHIRFSFTCHMQMCVQTAVFFSLNWTNFFASVSFIELLTVYRIHFVYAELFLNCVCTLTLVTGSPESHILFLFTWRSVSFCHFGPQSTHTVSETINEMCI